MGGLFTGLAAFFQAAAAGLTGVMAVSIITVAIAGTAIAVLLGWAAISHVWRVVALGVVLLAAGGIAAAISAAGGVG